MEASGRRLQAQTKALTMLREIAYFPLTAWATALESARVSTETGAERPLTQVEKSHAGELLATARAVLGRTPDGRGAATSGTQTRPAASDDNGTTSQPTATAPRRKTTFATIKDWRACYKMLSYILRALAIVDSSNLGRHEQHIGDLDDRYRDEDHSDGWWLIALGETQVSPVHMDKILSRLERAQREHMGTPGDGASTDPLPDESSPGDTVWSEAAEDSSNFRVNEAEEKAPLYQHQLSSQHELADDDLHLADVGASGLPDGDVHSAARSRIVPAARSARVLNFGASRTAPQHTPPASPLLQGIAHPPPEARPPRLRQCPKGRAKAGGSLAAAARAHAGPESTPPTAELYPAQTAAPRVRGHCRGTRRGVSGQA